MDITISNIKEVYFHQYCPQCKHEDLPGDEEPCNECLTQFFNSYSHKPVKFEKKDGQPGPV